MHPFVGLILVATLGLCLIMAGAWAIQKRTGQSGWVDVSWTYGLGLAGVFLALWPVADGGSAARRGLIAALFAIWALRLGTHVARRTMGGGDDPRYAKLKQDWGAQAQPKMFGFLQVQAVAAALLALAPFVAARAPRPELDARDAVGGLILVAAIIGEALADQQLRRFASDPANKGRVCDVGLWRWSRHPNYFFEWLGWVAYPVIALTAGYGWGWLALIAPAYMYYLLRYVSGVPPLEQHMERTRPEAFHAYAARTSIFFPLPPSDGRA